MVNYLLKTKYPNTWLFWRQIQYVDAVLKHGITTNPHVRPERATSISDNDNRYLLKHTKKTSQPFPDFGDTDYRVLISGVMPVINFEDNGYW